ncbi:MAG: MATE family efflux transporter [Pyrinomonadaceae bacterium]|nr:MATE family efflux transporter [Pyrinomonadaceae bacterium]
MAVNEDTQPSASIISSPPHSNYAPTRTRTANYFAGLLTGYAVAAAAIIISLWLTPFTLRFLDREEYAVFAFTNDIWLWLFLFDLGTTAGLRTQVAQLTGLPDTERLNRLASTSFFAQLALALFVLVAGVALSMLFPSLLGVRPDLREEATVVVALLAVGASFSLGTRTFSVLLTAHQQIHIDNLIQLALLVVRTVLIMLLLATGWKLYALSVAGLIAIIVGALLAFVRYRATLPGLAIRFDLFSWGTLRNDIRSHALWFGVVNLAAVVVYNMDRAVAARAISFESVTTWTLTGQAYSLAGVLIMQMTSTALPGLGQLIGKGDTETAFATYLRLIVLCTGISIVAALSLWAGNGAFVTWWVGAKLYGGTWLDAALALNLVVAAWTLSNRTMLTAMIMARPLALSRTVEATINLGLSILLAQRVGLVGIAVATAIAGLLTSCWYIPQLVLGRFRRSFSELLRHALAPLTLLALILLPAAWWMRFLTEGTGISGALLAMCAVSALGFVLLWSFVFDANMRAQSINIVAQTYRTLHKRFFTARES